MSALSEIVEAISTPTLETLADEIERYLDENSVASVKNFASAIKAELTRRGGDE